MYKNAHNSAIAKSENLKTPQLPFNSQKDKQHIFIQKKPVEPSQWMNYMAVHNNPDTSEEQVPEEHTGYDPICVTLKNKTLFRDTGLRCQSPK